MTYNFPPTIVPIVEKLRHYEEFKMNIRNLAIVLKFTSEGPVDGRIPQAAAEVVQYLWEFRNCVKGPFVAEFFLCDAPKYLPKPRGVLGQDNVNTGYSEPCHSLVVYRQQEWFKVFIHESFHYLGLDKGVAEKIHLDMFTIPNVVSLREAFCETWARIIQSDMMGVPIEKERRHSVRNMVRTLRHMGLRYTDLWEEKGRAYVENTNVFAYVILSAVLLHTPADFERMAPRFRCTAPTLLDLIRRNYRDTTFLRRVRAAEGRRFDPAVPFVMSAVELNL